MTNATSKAIQNALALLSDIARRTSDPAIRELTRDASAPLRNALLTDPAGYGRKVLTDSDLPDPSHL